MNSFPLLHIDSQLYRENQFVDHYFDSQLSARYDSNFLRFKQLPDFTQYQLYELYLTSFHSLHELMHIKFIWPENEVLSEPISSYLISKQYTITTLSLYAMNSLDYKGHTTASADVREVTEEITSSYLQAQRLESMRYGEKFAEQKDQLLRKLLISPRHKIYAAMVGTQVVGSITVHINRRGIELDEFYVLEAFQRQGIGMSLMTAIAKDFPNTQMILVTDANDTAKDMYEKLGFIKEGFRVEFIKCFD